MNPTNIRIEPSGIGNVQFGRPDAVNVVFFTKLAPDAEATRRAGRTMKKAVDYVRIQHPGERDYSESPVSDKPQTPLMYPRQWEAFQKKKQYVPEGTPIELLFPQDAELTIADTLRGLGIQTIEQLADLSTTSMDSVGLGAQAYVTHAKKYMEMANKGVAYHKLQKELSDRDTKIAVLENNLRLLQSQIERLAAERSGAAQQTFLTVPQVAPIAQQALPPLPAYPPMGQQQMQQAQQAPAEVFIPWNAPPAATASPPQITEQPATVKKRGWPKGKPRGPRNPIPTPA